MSKSLGNLVFVGDLCKEWDPAAVRLALLAHHYREDWDWRTDEDMPAAAARLALWRSAPDGDGDARGLAGACGPRSTTTWTRRRALRALDDEATAGRPVAAGARCSASTSEPASRVGRVTGGPGGPGPRGWSSTL